MEVAEAVVAGATAGGAVVEVEIVEVVAEVAIEAMATADEEVEIVEVAAEVAIAVMVTADEEVVIGVMVVAEEEAPFEAAAAADVAAVAPELPLLSIKVSTASLSWTRSSPSLRTPLSSVCTLPGVMIFPSMLESSPWAPPPHQALPPNTSPCALLLGPKATRSYCGPTISRST